MVLNYVLLLAGLVLCLGGIYFKKVGAVLMGFMWGALTPLLAVLVFVRHSRISYGWTLAGMLLGAVVIAAVSVLFEKPAPIVSGFLSAAFITLLLLALRTGRMAQGIMLIIALAVGLLIAAVAFKFRDHAFVILTALSGGLLAALGGRGVIMWETLTDIIDEIYRYGQDELRPLLTMALIIGVVGLIVQLYRLKELGGIGEKRPLAAFSGAEEGTPSLAGQIKEEKYLLALLVFVVIVSPLICLGQQAAGLYIMSNLYITSYFGNAIAAGILPYFVLTRNTKFNLCVAALGSLHFLMINFTVLRFIGIWGIILGLARYFLYWAVLRLAAKVIRSASVKPFVLTLLVTVLDAFVYRWLGSLYIAVLYILRDPILRLALILVPVTGYLTFRIRKRVDMFRWTAAPAAPQPKPVPKPATAKNTVPQTKQTPQQTPASAQGIPVPEGKITPAPAVMPETAPRPKIVLQPTTQPVIPTAEPSQKRAPVTSPAPQAHNFCYFCGAKLNGDELFCGSCGSKLR